MPRRVPYACWFLVGSLIFSMRIRRQGDSGQSRRVNPIPKNDGSITFAYQTVEALLQRYFQRHFQCSGSDGRMGHLLAQH